MRYIQQFDAIRAIAVILVVISHWMNDLQINRIFGIGAIGVNVFFVLSGFLITNILLTNKKRIEDGSLGEHKTKAIGRFIMRRALRIFPIYYALLIFVHMSSSLFPNPIPFPGDLKYYIFYVQNFLFYLRQGWSDEYLAPTWSLAVEEQFYLVWPWLVFFIQAKYLKLFFVASFMAGLGFALLLPMLLERQELTLILTPTCLDAFGAGAILSYLIVFEENEVRRFSRITILVSLGTFVIFLITHIYSIDVFVPDRTMISVSTVGLLLAILTQKTGYLLSWVLNNKILVSIGKVSYGIYLFHKFIPLYLGTLLKWMSNHPIFNRITEKISYVNGNYRSIFLIECLIVLLLVSFVSFYFYERPILKLKRYF